MTPGRNLLLVSLDTLRADVAYSGRFPTIEKLRSRGTTFRTTVSSSPLTPISHATVMTGVQPPVHGVRHLLREQLPRHFPTIASVLRDADYRTGAIVSCPGLNRWYGIDTGFDHYDDWIPPLADGRNALEVIDVELRGTALKRAPMVADRAAAWLTLTPDRPVCLFAHFFDAHWPYEAPEDVGVAVDNPYEGEVAFMDHYLGELLTSVEALGLTDENTTIVVFSDHGEDLAGWYPNDHAGDLGHPEEKGHGALLFDATQLVPLIVVASGRAPAGAEIVEQVRLVDVMPTVLDLLGVDCPNDVDGASLVPMFDGAPSPSNAAYCETFYREEIAENDERFQDLLPLKAVRSASHKVVWEHGGEFVEVFDLERDPDELVPLPGIIGATDPKRAVPTTSGVAG